MCLSGGCDSPNDDHGDPRNITLARLREAAEAQGITVDEAAANILEGVSKSEA